MVSKSIPGPPRRRRRRQARVRDILVTALRLVEKRGLEGLTLHEIAAELDYSVAALYRYFPSKAALVGELQRRVVWLLDAKLGDLERRCRERASRRRFVDGEGALLFPVATAAFYAHLAASAPAPFGLLSVSLGDPRHLLDDAQAGRVIAAAQPIFSRLAENLSQAERARLLAPGDPMERAVVLWAALHGVVQLHKLTRIAPGLLETGRLIPALLRSLLLGWGADPARVERVLAIVTRDGLGLVSVAARDLETLPELSAPDAASPRRAPARRAGRA